MFLDGLGLGFAPVVGVEPQSQRRLTSGGADMLKIRTFRIVLVDERHGGGVDESAGARVAPYSGEEVRVKLP
jgi:hypothetical protein